MKSTFYFLVKPLDGKEFCNENRDGIILNTNIEDHKSTQRLAEVVGLPDAYYTDVSVGDMLLVHHNTFRTYYDMKGRMKRSAYHIVDDIYYVEIDRVYLHIKNGEESVYGDYCFVEPMSRDQEGFQYSTRAEKELIGKVALVSDKAKQEGVSVGDMITFAKDSEYEFRINDNRYYRIPNKNIVAVL